MIIAMEVVAAPPAAIRLTLDDLAESLGRAQSPRVTTMAVFSPRYSPEAGVGGRRLTEGGSGDGDLEEVVEFSSNRSSRSAIRPPKGCTSAESAPRASEGSVPEDSRERWLDHHAAVLPTS